MAEKRSRLLLASFSTACGRDGRHDECAARWMSVMGKRGGAKGGRARAAALTPERRREIAVKAGRARWRGHKQRRT